MIEGVVNRIVTLIEDGVPANDIVVLAPFVSDALRFAFMHQMEERGVPARSHRPSRPLNEEPAAKTLLTLTRLAFPHWQMLPEPFDVAQALHQAIINLGAGGHGKSAGALAVANGQQICRSPVVVAIPAHIHLPCAQTGERPEQGDQIARFAGDTLNFPAF
jgi:hypothetical protein